MNNALAETCLRYLDGDLTADELRDFNRLLVESKQAGDLLAQFALDQQHYRATPPESQVAPHIELLELDAYANAHAQQRAASADAKTHAKRSDPYPGTLAILRDPGFWGYVVSTALRTKPAKWAAAAAVLLLAATLLFVFTSGPSNTPQAPGVARTPTEPGRVGPDVTEDLTPAVATLTATHNAQWGGATSAAPGPTPTTGSSLYPNDPLTLSAGYVQITTRSGAVAILQAPATVELLNNNALRLHAGRLVGICETQSSEGFVVQTNNAVVTDLGTAFGVAVMPDGSTQAVVFSGQIELREVSVSPDRVTNAVRLTEGWSSRIDPQGRLQQAADRVTQELASSYVMSIQEVAGRGEGYRRMVLASDPMVYWGFDERLGTTANLAGQQAWSGQAIGRAGHGRGLFGAGLKLTGALESMGGFTSATALDLGKLDAYTLEAWYRADEAHHGRVVSLDDVDRNGQLPPQTLAMIELSQDPTNRKPPARDGKQVRYVHRNPLSSFQGDGKDLFSDQPSPIGQWVHVVAVKDGNSMRLYVNGELVQKSDDLQPVATRRPMTLCVGVSAYAITPDAANRADEFRPFAGIIDELAVYGSALSEQTIQAHYQSGRPDPPGAVSP